ncbi:hypothetical protein NADFUDRAFT_83290 [Nadsonia fulvescens var. elongata DSM 6958]|uniref:SDE2-like domain-containing protein n=1 Tax=Nadsonia fulvescens var. elongata DSM 6958 TaxID=857566 RepID=A0A1E3PIL7_9ASCO|nr:hypothetical protein NADFUDRAFT_83290 [Nadsonia fulvescens var. elongata DSM 6958]
MISIFVQTIDGCKDLRFEVSSDTRLCDILLQVRERLPEKVADSTTVSLKSGFLLPFNDDTIASRFPGVVDVGFLDLRVNRMLCGGKGGFGSMLRAQGGRMRRKRGNRAPDDRENDQLRTLDGRRMRSIRQAKELAEYLEKAPGLVREQADKKKQKLLSIINAKSPTDNIRFGDMAYLEESENIIDEIRKSVNKAMGSNESHFQSMSEDSEEEYESMDNNECGSPSSFSSKNDDHSFKGKEKVFQNEDIKEISKSPASSLKASLPCISTSVQTKSIAPKAMGFFGDESDESDDEL